MIALRRSAHALGLFSAIVLASCSSQQQSIQRLLDAGTGKVTLPSGPTELSKPLRIPPNAHDLEIAGGEGTVLRGAPNFTGKALIMIQNAARVKLRDFAIDGSRKTLERPSDLPPDSSSFLVHFNNNGILVDESKEVAISNLEIREVASFAILVSRTKSIVIEKTTVEDAGGRNSAGHNNTTGGILLEEGTDDFVIRHCTFRRLLGNGVWTHSTFLSPRNYTGLIENNQFDIIGRDAIQVGHANRVRVLNNRGRFIGYPFSVVDVVHGAIPVAVDTAGKVDESVYSKNIFEEINGKCFDLDGFHDGEVSENVCTNRGTASDYPNGQYALVVNNTNAEMKSESITIRDNTFDGTKFGGIFLVGEGHKVLRNKLLNLNKWHCDDGLPGAPCPVGTVDAGMLRAGVYLGEKAHRIAPAKDITIEDNEISGFNMQSQCVVSDRLVDMTTITVRNNRCVGAK